MILKKNFCLLCVSSRLEFKVSATLPLSFPPQSARNLLKKKKILKKNLKKKKIIKKNLKIKKLKKN